MQSLSCLGIATIGCLGGKHLQLDKIEQIYKLKKLTPGQSEQRQRSMQLPGNKFINRQMRIDWTKSNPKL